MQDHYQAPDPARSKKKAYLVSTGVYSDYTIRAVCSSKERAEIVASKLEDANGIEEFEIDSAWERVKRGCSTYTICWDDDFRNVINISGDNGDPYKEDEGIKEVGLKRYCCDVEARDSQHAIKIAQDRFIRYKATIAKQKEDV